MSIKEGGGGLGTSRPNIGSSAQFSWEHAHFKKGLAGNKPNRKGNSLRYVRKGHLVPIIMLCECAHYRASMHLADWGVLQVKA